MQDKPLTCGCRGRLAAPPQSPAARHIGQAMRDWRGWLEPVLTLIILFVFIFALPAIFGGL